MVGRQRHRRFRPAWCRRWAPADTRALPCRPGNHRGACRSGDRPRPGRPCSRRLSARARMGARGVACIPDDRHGRRLAGFPVRGTPASGAGDQLFRDERGRGAGDLARDGFYVVGSVIASPEHGCLGDAAVPARNGGTGAEPLGVPPLGLGQAEPLTAGGLAAGRAAVRGRAPRGAPFDRPPACGVRVSIGLGHARPHHAAHGGGMDGADCAEQLSLPLSGTSGHIPSRATHRGGRMSPAPTI